MQPETLPHPTQPTPHHKAARQSTWFLLAAFIVPFILSSSFSGVKIQAIHIIIGVIGITLLITAFGTGIYALIGIKKHGAKGLLARGVVSVTVSAVALASCLLAIDGVKLMKLKSIEESLNKKAQQPQRGEYIITKASFGSPRMMTIEFKFPDICKSQIDMQKWNASVIPKLKESAIATPIQVEMIRLGAKVKHRYFDTAGELISEIEFQPE